MPRIGLLVGREESFPRAFLDALNGLGRDDLQAEMLKLGGTRMDELCAYDVIVDRISHDVPYYRLALKQAALSGTRIVNNPYWCSADDKFLGYSLAHRLGLAVPRTVLLPNKEYGEEVSEESLANLEYPIDWEGHVKWVGLPAFLKPAVGGGWRGVNRVDSIEELLHHYDRSGRDTMVLQQAVDFDRYVRCFCFGRKDVVVCRYDPEGRAYLPLEDGWLDKKLLRRIERDSVAICEALGYDCNTVEFAIADGIPWAIDFTNIAPDMEVWSITPEYFDSVVAGMVHLVVRLADQPGKVPHPRWEDLLAGRTTSDGRTERTSRKRSGAGAASRPRTTKKASTGAKKKTSKKKTSKKKTSGKARKAAE